MQREIATMTTRVPIRILGVNGIGQEIANATVTMGRTAPWLQDIDPQNAWTRWRVEYRDVVIIDPLNGYTESYNLTLHDLSVPANYSALRDRLLMLAR